jgi:homoserine dehydrogenase
VVSICAAFLTLEKKYNPFSLIFMNTPLRIAIAGLGTVGQGTIEILQQQAALLAARAGRELKIVAVSARDAAKKREVDVSAYRFERDPMAIASAPDVDVVVELIGGAEGTAKELVEAALANKKHVVTANKALIATHGAALAELAAQNNVSLMFEASVAGGIPILKCLRDGLAANEISKVIGILNGTCNYILTHMWEDKRELADVLAEAQKLGYAETEPSFDIDGIDASHKLAILAALAFGTAPDLAGVRVEGIRHISLRDMQFADELGYTIRLLGVATSQSQRVCPMLVAKNSNLAATRGVFNAVQIESHAAGAIFMQGRGAGGLPTGSAVVADIIDIARGNKSAAFGVRYPSLVVESGAASPNFSSYYIRLAVIDKPGVLADITAVFRDCGISLKSFLQHGQAPGEKVYIVVATHETSEAEMKQALASIALQSSILESPVCIRIES